MATPLFDVSRQMLTSAQVPHAALTRDFERALSRGGREFNLQIAGHRLRIRVAGDDWARVIAAAMGHLDFPTSRSTEPAIQVDVWDVRQTAVAPTQPVAPDPSAPPVLMKTSEDGSFVGEERQHSVTWLDGPRCRIVGYVDSATRLNLDERARPFHKLLSAWLEGRGVQFVHAGLIRHAGRGILFVGNGGAGKSTSSISCLRAGMQYLGDDFIGLGIENGRFIGHGLYASCLLNVHHIERFPDLKALAHSPNWVHEDKCVLYLADAFPNSLCQRSPIDALVLPTVVDSEQTTFEPATRADTLRAIAPTSVMFLPRPNRAAFDRLVQLVEKTPCYRLKLGRRVDLIPSAVRSLAESLGETRDA